MKYETSNKKESAQLFFFQQIKKNPSKINIIKYNAWILNT